MIPAERPLWQPDADVAACGICHVRFSMTKRKHHCRCCGKIYCAECSQQKLPLPAYFEYTGPQRVCDECATPLSRLSKALDSQLLAAQFFLRAHSMNFVRHLPDIGSRSALSKIFVLAKTEKGADRVVAVCTAQYSDVNLAADKKRAAFHQLIKQIKKHPFIIHSKSTCQYFRDKDALVTVAPVFSRGSLHDRIFGVSSNQAHQLSYAEKYSLTLKKRGKPLTSRSISLFGRALLEAFRSLRALRVPCLHAHSGNVMIDNESQHKCFLSVEAVAQSFAGVSPRQTDLFVTLAGPPQPFSLSQSLVCQFAHILYEMCTGQERDIELPMRESRDLLVGGVLEPFYPLLCSLFRGEAAWWDRETRTLVAPSKEPLPNLADLLANPLFSDEAVKLTNPDTLAGLAAFDKIKLDKEQKLIIKRVTETLHEAASSAQRDAQLLRSSSSRGSAAVRQSRSPALSPDLSPAISPVISPRAVKHKRKKKVFVAETPPKVLSLAGEAAGPGAASTTTAEPPTTSSGPTAAPPQSVSSSAPAPPPAPAPAAPPAAPKAPSAPPPPSLAPKSAPPPASGGRNSLLASIRSANKSSMLKKVKPPR